MKLATLEEMAAEMGVVVYPVKRLKVALSRAMWSRMRNRRASYISQSVAFKMENFPMSAAEAILPPSRMISGTPSGTTTWRLKSLASLVSFMRKMGSGVGGKVAGVSRALKTKTESVSRVVSTILPGLEITHYEDSLYAAATPAVPNDAMSGGCVCLDGRDVTPLCQSHGHARALKPTNYPPLHRREDSH